MPFCCLCFFWGSCSLFLSLSFLLAFFTEWGARTWVEAPCSQASLRWVRGKLRLWRDSAWSECQYLQPFSLSNSFSPKEVSLTPWKESYDQPTQHIKKQRHYFVNKGPSHQGYGFSSSHVWMWKLDYKESWLLKNWCFWNVVLEKTLESPLDCKEIQPVHPKGNQSWVFIGRTDAEAETLILLPPDVKSWTHLKRSWC